MYVGRDWDPMQTTESSVLGFDFVNDVESGEQILSSSWTLTVAAGVDANPQLHLAGPSTVIASKDSGLLTVTIQRIYGLLPGVTYTGNAQVTTDLGNIVNLYSHVHCEDFL